MISLSLSLISLGWYCQKNVKGGGGGGGPQKYLREGVWLLEKKELKYACYGFVKEFAIDYYS